MIGRAEIEIYDGLEKWANLVKERDDLHLRLGIAVTNLEYIRDQAELGISLIAAETLRKIGEVKR